MLGDFGWLRGGVRVPAAGCEIICYRLTAGQVFLVIIICTPAGGGEFVITSGGVVKKFAGA